MSEEEVKSEALFEFDPELLDTVREKVKEAGDTGFRVDHFTSISETLAAGYLGGKGEFEVIAGGGSEPYRIRVKQC